MGMFLISRDWGTCQDQRENGWRKKRGKPAALCEKLKLGQNFIFQHDNDLKHTAKATQAWLRKKNINVLVWSSQSPDLNPIENPWHNLKIAVHQHSPCNLTELEQFCTEEWANISQSRCAQLVETYRNRLTAGIALKCASTKY